MNWKNLLPEGMYEFESSYLHAWVDSNLKLMYSEWLCRPSAEQFRDGVHLFVEWLHRLEVENWIDDSSMLDELSTEQQHWAHDLLIAAIMNSQLKKVAQVSSSGPLSNAVLERIIKEKKDESLQVSQFETYMTAADWVAKIKL